MGNDLLVAAVVCACVFGGALAGMSIRQRLPGHHLEKPTEDAVRVGMSTVATLTALVIGLLVAAARGSFDTKSAEIQEFSADIILLDRQLVHYGPEAKEACQLLHRFVVDKIASTWPEEADHPTEPGGWTLLETVQDRVRALVPADDAQRWL